MGKIDLADKLDGARARVEAEIPVEDRGLAKFARLTRKDARVRADQDAALTALAKRLMRRRPVKAERITENTLIRVAIDLLLTHADELSGSTEDELRDSVTSEVPKARRPEGANFRTAGGSTLSAPGVRNSDTSELPTSRASEHPNSRSSEVTDTVTPDVADTTRPEPLAPEASTAPSSRSQSEAPARPPLGDGPRVAATLGPRGVRPPSDPLAAVTHAAESTGMRR